MTERLMLSTDAWRDDDPCVVGDFLRLALDAGLPADGYMIGSNGEGTPRGHQLTALRDLGEADPKSHLVSLETVLELHDQGERLLDTHLQRGHVAFGIFDASTAYLIGPPDLVRVVAAQFPDAVVGEPDWYLVEPWSESD
ncbi:MAG: hypothetical protein AAGA37_06670 [Actinomycetota bacterium]